MTRRITVTPLLLTYAALLAASDRLVLLSTRSDRGAAPNLRAFRMVDERRGWTILESGFWYTDDGAKTWRQVSGDNANPGGPVESWGVTTNGEAWALGQRSFSEPPVDLVRVAPDGTSRRLALPCPTVAECLPVAADFTSDGRRGFLFALAPTGAKGRDRVRAFKTNDGGGHWIGIDAPEAVVSGGKLYARAVGDSSIFLGVDCDLYVSLNWGRSWQRAADEGLDQILSGAWAMPLTIRFTGPKTGWMRTDDGWILTTRDAGASWVVSALGHQRSPFPNTIDEWISFSDSSRGSGSHRGRGAHDSGRRHNLGASENIERLFLGRVMREEPVRPGIGYQHS